MIWQLCFWFSVWTFESFIRNDPSPKWSKKRSGAWNKAQFRDLVSNTCLVSTVSKAPEQITKGPGFYFHWKQFFAEFLPTLYNFGKTWFFWVSHLRIFISVTVPLFRIIPSDLKHRGLHLYQDDLLQWFIQVLFNCRRCTKVISYAKDFQVQNR